jgi:alanyl-tRNA synthetase
MKSSEIRKAFLEYFRQKKHEIVKSSPLIPADDPTLLFTNAGMVQFKGVFLGLEKRPYSRAASCQKCMRAGGKHSDLENVGHTARHHTFFEMLGNFSFGDYFKKEAIIFAWELLTEWYRLPKDRLWVSVFEEDEEAETLWKEFTDVDPAKIVRLGAKDNFWQMGDTGPCGPCSEIIIDQGPDVGCQRPECNLECDCDRYLELWNLVFMQFNRDQDGSLTPLPKPSIDTGMGLERISAVLQGKTTNYDTDLFLPIIEFISSATGVIYGSSENTDISMRVIADHIRASVFLISEGLIPSNEGRGYVLRRIIRRASRHARLLGVEEPLLYRVADAVVEVMGEVYPEITDEIERTKKLLRIEEERFGRTLEKGLNLLDELIEEIKREGRKIIPGEEVFRLYDTYGFPLDLVKDIANDEGLEVDKEGFQRRLQEQRQKARVAAAAGSMEGEITFQLESSGYQTEFVGYSTLKVEAKVVEILKEDRSAEMLSEAEEGILILDRTPFYAASGGQVGDTGVIHSADVYIRVNDTLKHPSGIHMHKVKIRRGSIKKGDRVVAEVDEQRRQAIMRNHTATHLLHRALRDVLGEHVKQSGSLVSDDRLRFDFTHYQAVSKEEIEKVESIVNEKILEDLKVRTDIMSLDDAINAGAVALFDEKYGEQVRVVSVGEFSKELCGGTHCKSTGEIGLFLVVSEGSVASGIRRMEAITGTKAYEYVRELRNTQNQLEEVLKSNRPLEKVKRLLEDVKTLQKELERLKTGSLKDEIAEVVRNAKKIGDVSVVTVKKDGLNHKELRLLADNIRDRLRSGIIIAASVNNSQAAFVCMVTKDLTDRFNAGTIMKRLAEEVGGSGGGKPEMAQGGTKNIEKIETVLQRIEEIVGSNTA